MWRERPQANGLPVRGRFSRSAEDHVPVARVVVVVVVVGAVSFTRRRCNPTEWRFRSRTSPQRRFRSLINTKNNKVFFIPYVRIFLRENNRNSQSTFRRILAMRSSDASFAMFRGFAVSAARVFRRTTGVSPQQPLLKTAAVVAVLLAAVCSCSTAAAPSSSSSSVRCDAADRQVNFELLTGYAASPAAKHAMRQQLALFTLPQCINACKSDDQCAAVTYETGVCVSFAAVPQKNANSAEKFGTYTQLYSVVWWYLALRATWLVLLRRLLLAFLVLTNRFFVR